MKISYGRKMLKGRWEGRKLDKLKLRVDLRKEGEIGQAGLIKSLMMTSRDL